MLVFDVQTANIKLPTAHVFAGQVALDGRDALAREFEATQFRQVALGALQESHRINVRLGIRGVRGGLGVIGKKLADQEAQLNISLTEAEKERGITNKIKKQTEAAVLVIEQEREAKLRTMKAETEKQIADIVEAACRAKDAGYDGVEIPMVGQSAADIRTMATACDQLGLERTCVAFINPEVNPISPEGAVDELLASIREASGEPQGEDATPGRTWDEFPR